MIDTHNEQFSSVSENDETVETKVDQETVEEAIQDYRDQNMQYVQDVILPHIEDDTGTESTSEEEDGIEETEEVHEDFEVEGEASDEDEGQRLKEMEEKNAADIAAFRKLPFIDLYTKHAELVEQRDQMKSIKGMVDQMKSGSFPGGNDLQIPVMNALDNSGNLDQSAKEFLDQYDELMAESERIIKCAETVLMEYNKEQINSSTFLANSLCESIDEKIGTMKESDHENKAFIIKRMSKIRDAYADRTNYEYLFNKLRYYYNIQSTYKEFSKMGGSAVIKYLDKTFGGVFKDPKMKKFLTEVTEMVTPVYSLYDVTFFAFWLAKIYEKEYTSGNFTYPKTLIMNVYDAVTGVYDLPGGKEALVEAIKTMMTLLMTFALLKKKTDKSKKEVEHMVNEFWNDLVTVYENTVQTIIGREEEASTEEESPVEVTESVAN